MTLRPDHTTLSHCPCLSKLQHGATVPASKHGSVDNLHPPSHHLSHPRAANGCTAAVLKLPEGILCEVVPCWGSLSQQGSAQLNYNVKSVSSPLSKLDRTQYLRFVSTTNPVLTIQAEMDFYIGGIHLHSKSRHLRVVSLVSQGFVQLHIASHLRRVLLT